MIRISFLIVSSMSSALYFKCDVLFLGVFFSILTDVPKYDEKKAKCQLRDRALKGSTTLLLIEGQSVAYLRFDFERHTNFWWRNFFLFFSFGGGT